MPLKSFVIDDETGEWTETWAGAGLNVDIDARVTSDGLLIVLGPLPPKPVRAFRLGKEHFTISSVVNKHGKALFFPDQLAKIGGGTVNDTSSTNPIWSGISIALVEVDQVIRPDMDSKIRQEMEQAMAELDALAAIVCD